MGQVIEKITGGEVAVKMNKTLKIIFNATLVVVLGSLVSCGDENPPASQPQVVREKINAEQPTATPAAKPIVSKGADEAAPGSKPESVKPVEQIAEDKNPAAPSTEGKTAPLKAVSDKLGTEKTPVTSDLIKASLEIASSYDPKGRIDPFAPLFSDEPKAPVVRAGSRRKTKRTPQGPLEKVALRQLKLTAILRMPQGNRALVEDATGKGYVVKKGTYMGLNAGQVIKINKDSVLVEEEIQNMVGEYIINNTELKLQKTAGDQ